MQLKRTFYCKNHESEFSLSFGLINISLQGSNLVLISKLKRYLKYRQQVTLNFLYHEKVIDHMPAEKASFLDLEKLAAVGKFLGVSPTRRTNSYQRRIKGGNMKHQRKSYSPDDAERRNYLKPV